MANWYNIRGVEFHFNGPWADSEITFNGTRDSSCIDVEATMWERFNEDCEDVGTLPDTDKFAQYMQNNSDEVKYLIAVARGELND